MVNELDKSMAKSIGTKILLARGKADLTREQLAEKAGVEANSIYRYETGRQVPNFATVIRLAKGLNTSVSDLVPDDYSVEKNDDDPAGVLEWFYQMDVADQKFMLRQMMAMVGMKNAG